MSKLTEIQNELKVHKSQYNKFGKYNYRKCEDILEALKPILKKHSLTLVISDEVKQTGDFTYIESVCELAEDGKVVARSAAQAGIEKAGGMALPQAFGSASSYARKYSLGAMFLLDDTEDADATNTHCKGEPKKAAATVKKADEEAVKTAIEKLNKAGTMEDLKEVWGSLDVRTKEDLRVAGAKDEAKNVISNNT